MLDTIIEKTSKKLDLLKELKESQKYENCLYEIVTINTKRYLYDTKTGQEVETGGNPDRWLARHNIDKSKIYVKK